MVYTQKQITVLIVAVAGLVAIVFMAMIVANTKEMRARTGNYYPLPEQTYNPQETISAPELQTDGTNIRVEVR